MNTNNVVCSVPFNPPSDLINFVLSSPNFRDEVCKFCELKLQWDAEAIFHAKKFVLENIEKWDFSKGLEFAIAFTNSDQTKLWEFAYIKYWIEDNKLYRFSGECFEDLNRALSEDDALEIYYNVEERQKTNSLNSSSQLTLRSSQPKVHRLIARMKFHEFANVLDHEPKKYRVAINNVEETKVLLNNVIEGNKDHPFKIIFEFPENGLIRIRTTRWKNKMRMTVKNFDEKTVSIVEFVKNMFKEHNLEILHENISRKTINVDVMKIIEQIDSKVAAELKKLS